MRKIIAAFLSRIYGALLGISQASYRLLPFRVKTVKARVISVGNITWGGTGKTPLVAKLARDLWFYGKKVTVLTRGYGKDEVAELKKRLPNVPVIVGRDRVRTAREAVAKHQAEILILDDGFQHIRLHRDLDIVNINAALPFGPGGLLPQGTLREPLSHLSRAHVFVLTKSDIGSKNVHWIRQKLLSIKPDAMIFEAVHKPIRFTDPMRNRFIALGEMKGKRVAAISGIGDPYSFEKTVEMVGAQIHFAARFDDHHPFSESELLEFTRRCRELGLTQAVTTEKDFFRLDPVLRSTRSEELKGFAFLALQIEFQLADEEEFLKKCLSPV